MWNTVFYAIVIFLIFNNNIVVPSNALYGFKECCKRTVSPSCAKHCIYHNSVIRYSWPFLKGDCNWDKERDALRHCFMNEKDQTECCKALKVDEHPLCLEVCNGTLKAFSHPIGQYLSCRRYVKQVTKCAKRSWYI